MDKTYYDVNEDLIILKDGVVLNNLRGSSFYFKKENIKIKNSNSSYSLSESDFMSLYKEDKFFINDNNEETIDAIKDLEYYSFKHK